MRRWADLSPVEASARCQVKSERIGVMCAHKICVELI